MASARASRGLKADLYLQFGLSQTSDKFKESYRDPLDQQYVSLSIAIPILDWGRGKGKVRVAKSQVELVETQVAQGMTDFELSQDGPYGTETLRSGFTVVSSGKIDYS